MTTTPVKYISIHGLPRSGTSWLGQIFNSSPAVAYRFQPLFSYAFKSRLSATSSAEEIHKFFSDINNTNDDFVLQKYNVSGTKNPEFSKVLPSTHIVMKEVRYHYVVGNLIRKVPEIKIVGLVRNPCAVINSWFQAPKEFKPEWNKLEEWRSARHKNMNKPEEYYGFEKWKEVANLFISLSEKYPSNIIIVNYEDLNTVTEQAVKDIFDFCELKVEKQTADFIIQSRNTHSDDPYDIMRHKKLNDVWKNELDKTIINEIYSELTGTNLEQFLK